MGRSKGPTGAVRDVDDRAGLKHKRDTWRSVCDPHSFGPKHIEVSSAISFVCVCILTSILSFSFPLCRL